MSLGSGLGVAPGLALDAAGDIFFTAYAGTSGVAVKELVKTGAGYAASPITLAGEADAGGSDRFQAITVAANGDLFVEAGSNGDRDSVLWLKKTGVGATGYAGVVRIDSEPAYYGYGDYRDAPLLDADGAVFQPQPDSGDTTSRNYGSALPGVIARVAPLAGGGYAAVSRAGADGVHAVYSFSDAAGVTTGYRPRTNLVADGAGVLYGATTLGGPNSGGAIYQLTDVGFHAAPTVTSPFTLISANPSGTAGNGASGQVSFYGDGVRAVFFSAASDLVAGDTNGAADVFVRNLTTGVTTRIDLGAGGAQADGAASGNFRALDARGYVFNGGLGVVFTTSATNLAGADANGASDVIIKFSDGVTALVSADAAGARGNAGSFDPAVSPNINDTRILFSSASTNLVAADTRPNIDIYRKDVFDGTISLISATPQGVSGDGDSEDAHYSPDGRFVIFGSYASDLVAGDGNRNEDVFIRDPGAKVTQVVSTASGYGLDATGALGNGQSFSGRYSPDGGRIAFLSNSTNLVPGVTDGLTHLYVKTLSTGIVTVVDRSGGGVGNGAAGAFSWSPDGGRIAFGSDAANLVADDANDANDASDIFVKDLGTGAVTLITINGTIQVNGASTRPFYAADGRTLGFTTTGGNLGAVDTNGVADAYFVRLPATAANTAPTLAGTAQNQPAQPSQPVHPFANVVLTDPDGGQLETVTLTDPGGLGRYERGGFVQGDPRVFNADGRSYTFTGTAAQAQAALRAVTYTFLYPQDADQTLPVTVTDGVATVSDSSTSLRVRGGGGGVANTPPAIGGAQAGQADAAGVAITPFSTVTVTDPDAGQTETVTVMLSAADGAFSGAGFTGSGTTYTGVFASAAAAQAALRAAVFTPAAGQSATTGFTVTVSDGQAATTDSTTSVVATYTPPPTGGGGVVVAPPPSAALLIEFQNLSRAMAAGSDALTPGAPLYAAFQTEKTLGAQLDNGQLTLAQAEASLAHLVDGTTAVAVASYGFFTGATPTAAGLNYLVHSPANATDLNDAHYARFSTENRYINFAANLANGPGVGAGAFQANYGALSLADATAKAYAAVFGAPADAAKVSALLDTLVPDGLGGQETRAQYFAQYGGDGADGPGTKAAMVGFLLSNAVRDGSGVYGAATEHYLAAVAHGTAPAFGSELALNYGAPVNLVGVTPVADPTVTS